MCFVPLLRGIRGQTSPGWGGGALMVWGHTDWRRCCWPIKFLLALLKNRPFILTPLPLWLTTLQPSQCKLWHPCPAWTFLFLLSPGQAQHLCCIMDPCFAGTGEAGGGTLVYAYVEYNAGRPETWAGGNEGHVSQQLSCP